MSLLVTYRKSSLERTARTPTHNGSPARRVGGGAEAVCPSSRAGDPWPAVWWPRREGGRYLQRAGAAAAARVYDRP